MERMVIRSQPGSTAALASHTYRLFMQPPRLSWVCRTAAYRGDSVGGNGKFDPHRTARRHAVSGGLGRNSVAAAGCDSVASWRRS